MGMLDGFVAGAADEYTKQRGEDRADKFAEIKEKRVAEIKKTAATELVKTNATAAETKVKTDATAAEIEAKAKLTETTIVPASSSAREWDPVKKTWSYDQAPPKPDTTDKTGKLTEKDATTFFSKRGDIYFGKLDKSGIYSFGTDENAQMAAAASSVSNRLWLQQGGKLDANTIWAIVYKNIKANKLETADAIEAIGLDLDKYDAMWWNTEAESREVKALKAQALALDEEGKKEQMDLPAGPAGAGMLNEGEGQTKAPQAALDALKENPNQAADFKRKYGYLPPGY